MCQPILLVSGVARCFLLLAMKLAPGVVAGVDGCDWHEHDGGYGDASQEAALGGGENQPSRAHRSDEDFQDQGGDKKGGKDSEQGGVSDRQAGGKGAVALHQADAHDGGEQPVHAQEGAACPEVAGRVVGAEEQERDT